ncbi:MAG: hypothetical protein KKA79_05425, partial [Nanoarchaeota archaeon]|nr:hypothetical protein [Nanoarchaeota archaeon]
MIEVFDEYFLPEKFRKLKEEHYRDIFREDYKEVYEESKSFNDNEKTLFMMVDDEFAARAVLEFNKYDVRMRDFTVLKEFRSNGIAKKFMKSIEDIVLDYHNKMLRSEVKAYDIMFLRTYFYPKRTLYDLTTLPYDEKFQMGHFLEKHDFKAYKYNPKVLSEEEKMALQVYSSNYPEFLPSLRVFKKEIANNLELMPLLRNS